MTGLKKEKTYVKNEVFDEFELDATLCTSTAMHSTCLGLPRGSIRSNSILSALENALIYAFAPEWIAKNGLGYSAVRPVTFTIKDGVWSDARRKGRHARVMCVMNLIPTSMMESISSGD